MGNRNHGIVPERVGDGLPDSVNDDGLPVGAMRRADWAKLDYEVVYFTGTENGPIKIGRSISLVRRIRELQVGHPGLLHVWAVVPGNNLEEAIYHHRFAKDRIWGEWFARSDDMQELLDDRAAMRGDIWLPAPRQRDGLPQRNGGACDGRL